MRYNQMIPKGEDNFHSYSMECKCKPTMKVINNIKYVVHKPLDDRFVWMAVEIMLGITCCEHGDFVDKTYKKGEPHYHVPPPKLYYEYDHKKIDHR